MPTRSDAPLIAAFDIGASSLKGALSRGGAFSALPTQTYPRPRPSAEGVLDTIGHALDAAGLEASEVELRLAVAGLVSRGRVELALGLGWRQVALAELCRERLGKRPGRLCSDAEAAATLAVSETRDWPRAVALVIGTGVGGALLSGGAVVKARGLGHVEVEGGRPCAACQRPSCLEASVGASALAARGVGSYAELSSRADAGDSVAGELAQELGGHLAEATRAWWHRQGWSGSPKLWLGGGPSLSASLRAALDSQLGRDGFRASSAGRDAGVRGLLLDDRTPGLAHIEGPARKG